MHIACSYCDYRAGIEHNILVVKNSSNGTQLSNAADGNIQRRVTFHDLQFIYIEVITVNFILLPHLFRVFTLTAAADGRYCITVYECRETVMESVCELRRTSSTGEVTRKLYVLS